MLNNWCLSLSYIHVVFFITVLINGKESETEYNFLSPCHSLVRDFHEAHVSVVLGLVRAGPRTVDAGKCGLIHR